MGRRFGIIGLDIGGAAVKVANPQGKAATCPFALWKHPQRLSDVLTEILREWNPDRLAVTMTGELCDCFETKQEGVNHILDAVTRAGGKRPVFVWQTTGDFNRPSEARQNVWATAAANWHALATFAARYANGEPALLADIGSTTTDFIPISDDRPTAAGTTDPDRLASGELVYQGVARTPVCAIVSMIELGGRRYSTTSEWFATSADAYLMLDDLPEDPNNHDTADGRPATKDAARTRLARVIGADRTTFTPEAALELAVQVREAQQLVLRRAVRQAIARSGKCVRTIITCGQGEFALHRLFDGMGELASIPRRSLQQLAGAAVSTAACAFAVATLLAERQ